MSTRGTTWHAITVEPEVFDAQTAFTTDTLGATLTMEMNGDIAFGFRVDDVEATGAEIATAGGELRGGVNRVPGLDHACNQLRGVDGRVHGLDESGRQPRRGRASEPVPDTPGECRTPEFGLPPRRP